MFSPRAEQDVSDIWDYIAVDNIEAADRVLDALKQGMSSWRKRPASVIGGSY